MHDEISRQEFMAYGADEYNNHSDLFDVFMNAFKLTPKGQSKYDEATHEQHTFEFAEEYFNGVVPDYVKYMYNQSYAPSYLEGYVIDENCKCGGWECLTDEESDAELSNLVLLHINPTSYGG